MNTGGPGESGSTGHIWKRCGCKSEGQVLLDAKFSRQARSDFKKSPLSLSVNNYFYFFLRTKSKKALGSENKTHLQFACGI